MIDTSRGGVDLTFAIDRIERSGDYVDFQVSGQHNSESLGFVIRAKQRLGPPIWTPGARVDRDGVEFRSIGKTSDNLLRVLAEAYEVPLKRKHMKTVARFTSVTLTGDPSNVGRALVKVKLFSGGDASRTDYCELHLLVDPQRHRLQIIEKDAEYRRGVIAFLSAP